jgi:hypothetical protein
MCVSLSGLSSAPWLNRRLPGSIVLCSHIVDAACHIIIHSVTSSEYCTVDADVRAKEQEAPKQQEAPKARKRLVACQ